MASLGKLIFVSQFASRQRLFAIAQGDIFPSVILSETKDLGFSLVCLQHLFALLPSCKIQNLPLFRT
jgi:hypothetical protein